MGREPELRELRLFDSLTTVKLAVELLDRSSGLDPDQRGLVRTTLEAANDVTVSLVEIVDERLAIQSARERKRRQWRRAAALAIALAVYLGRSIGPPSRYRLPILRARPALSPPPAGYAPSLPARSRKSVAS